MKNRYAYLTALLMTSVLLPAAAQNSFYVKSTWTNQAVVGNDAGTSTGQPRTVPNGLTLGSDAFSTIQAAVNAATAGDTVFVYAGTYAEDLVVNKSLSLIGPNTGRPGNGTRVAEAIVYRATDNTTTGQSIAITASDVRVDGFLIDGNNPSISGSREARQGIGARNTSGAYDNIVVENNIVQNYPRGSSSATPTNETFPAAGISIQASTLSQGGIVRDNLVRNINFSFFSPELGAGIALINSIVAIQENEIENAGVGIGIARGNLGDTIRTSDNVLNNNFVGFLIVNGPVNLLVENTSVDNSGTFGLRMERNEAILNGANRALNLTIRGSIFQGTGRGASDFAGVAVILSGSGDGNATTVIEDCDIIDNENRGLVFQGDDVVGRNEGVVRRCRIQGNGFDPSGSTGFNFLVNRGAQVEATGCILSNVSQAITSNNAFTVASDKGGSGTEGGRLTVRGSFVDVPNAGTREALYQADNGYLDASGSWLGTTDKATIEAASFGSRLDLSPILVTGDADGNPANGFQPDFSTLYVGRLEFGFQLGGNLFVQEAATFDASVDTVRIRSDTYNEDSAIPQALALDSEGAVSIRGLDITNPEPQPVTLTGPLTITNNLTVGLGQFVTNGNVITLSPTATISENDFLDAKVQGVVRTTRTVGSNDTELFGDIGLTITSGAAAPGSVTVTRVTGTSLLGNAPDSLASIRRYYDVAPTNDVAFENLAFNYFTSELNGTENDLQLFRSELPFVAGGTPWSLLVSATDAINNRIIADDLDTLAGRYTAFTPDAPPLPIELGAFKATRRGDAVALTWTTLSELRTAYFVVERSTDGERFEPVGRVTARGDGHSRTPRHYTFTDHGAATLAANQAYYRLRDVDTDGASDLSLTRVVRLTDMASQLYPNPASGVVNVWLTTQEPVRLRVLDVRGQVVYEGTLTGTATLDVEGWAAGLYTFVWSDRTQTYRQRLAVQ